MSAVEHLGGFHAGGPTTIDTYTGVSVDLARPRSEDVRLADIARGLALTCRFAGQTERFCSVAEHSVIVLDLLERRWDPSPALRRFALLHDAAEAYLGDVVAPLKRLLAPLYGPLEAEWEAAVMKRFGVPMPSLGACAVLREADFVVRYAEGAVFKPAERTWQGTDRGVLPPRVRRPQGVPWETAEALFLREAHRLGLAD